jgi:hypothetical protein
MTPEYYRATKLCIILYDVLCPCIQRLPKAHATLAGLVPSAPLNRRRLRERRGKGGADINQHTLGVL